MGYMDLEKVFDHIFQGVLNGGCSSVWDIRPTVADYLVPVQPLLKAWCTLSVISQTYQAWPLSLILFMMFIDRMCRHVCGGCPTRHRLMASGSHLYSTHPLAIER